MINIQWEAFVREPGGGLLPQVSAPAVVERLVGVLDVRPGQRVLEIGTGSGYSAAMLAVAAGLEGRITSMELLPELVFRARHRLASAGVTTVEVVRGSGLEGLPGRSFDRIISWATPPDSIPAGWRDQLADGGRLVTPVHLAPRAACIATAVLERTGEELVGVGLVPGSFAPLDRVPRHDWPGPTSDQDVVVERGQRPGFWLSAAWVARLPSEDRMAASAEVRAARPVTSLDFPWADDDRTAFWAYLMAVAPAELSTAFWTHTGPCVGYSDERGFAFVALSGDDVLAGGSAQAATVLDSWGEDWEQAGRPGLDALIPVVKADGRGGLRVQAVLPPG